MGTSFTTAHIYNAGALTKAQFKKAFTDMMKAKGYTASDEENAALTYTLAFSPDRKWVTVLTDGADTRREAAELAKALKMHAVMIDLVDSDFAELSLFDETGAHKDTLTLGDSYLEDAAPMGNPAAWQPLLCGSWEQVQEIQNSSYTFAEDSLAQFAPLIGMDSGNILLDNDSADDDNAVVLHFKKAAEKKLTLNSAFVKVFGEGLLPLGFVKVKGKPSFIKNINDEIIYTVTVGKDLLEDNAFNIFTAVSTIYDTEIYFRIDNINCRHFFSIYSFLKNNPNMFDLNKININSFNYFKNNENDSFALQNEMEKAYNLFLEYVLPVLTKAVDLETTLFTIDDLDRLLFPLSIYLFISDADRYFERKRAQLIKKLKCMTRYGQEDFDEYSYTIEYECIEGRVNRYKAKIKEELTDKQKYDDIIAEYKKNRIKNLKVVTSIV